MTTSLCFYSNRELLGNSGKVKKKQKAILTSVYSFLTIITQSWALTNILVAEKKKDCVQQWDYHLIFVSFFNSSRYFYTSLTSYNKPHMAKISPATLEKTTWGFRVFKESMKDHTVSYWQRLVWTHHLPFIDSTKVCSLRIHYI